jgi:hypothetical protein
MQGIAENQLKHASQLGFLTIRNLVEDKVHQLLLIIALCFRALTVNRLKKVNFLLPDKYFLYVK